MAYLLLQSGPQAKAAQEGEAKEAEEKAVKKRATKKVALMKAALEEDMKGPSEWPHQEDMGYADEPLISGSDSSSLVEEVANELQYLQLPWEQPQLGLADVRDNMSNKEPLLKCCEEDDNTNKGSAEDPEQLKQLQQGVPRLHHWLSKQTDVPVKPLRVLEELGFFNVDHRER